MQGGAELAQNDMEERACQPMGAWGMSYETHCGTPVGGCWLGSASQETGRQGLFWKACQWEMTLCFSSHCLRMTGCEISYECVNVDMHVDLFLSDVGALKTPSGCLALSMCALAGNCLWTRFFASKTLA